MIAGATGASAAVMRLMTALATRKPEAVSTSATHATGRFTRKWRVAVRGFFWSMAQSINRLNNMAAVRAKTMQANTRRTSRADGRPLAAMSSAPNAKGSAKIVCEKRINRRKRLTIFPGTGSIRCQGCRNNSSRRCRAPKTIGVPCANSIRSKE